MGIPTSFDLELTKAGARIERVMPFGEWVECRFVGVLSDGRIAVECANRDPNDDDCVQVYRTIGLRMKAA